ncbi:MAG: hypothetical protein V1855_00025 [bacterium]
MNVEKVVAVTNKVSAPMNEVATTTAALGKVALEDGAQVAKQTAEILGKSPHIIAQEGGVAKAVQKVAGDVKRDSHAVTSIEDKINKNLAKMYREKALGRGSTGQKPPGEGMVPKNLIEQLSMKEVLSNPLAEAKELKSIAMTDPRWLAEDGWVKMGKNVHGIEIHFLYNKKTKLFDDFKFKR